MNYKLKTLLLPILCILIFCSCASNEKALPKHSLNNPTIEPQVVHLDIEEELENQLLNSAIFKEARERNAIILLDGVVITDGESSKNILEEFWNRDTGTFCVYKFYSQDNSPDSVIYSIYRKDKDKLRVSRNLSMNWEFAGEFRDYESIDDLKINQYGYLIANQQDDRPLCNQVINDTELYENGEELANIYEKYVSPISVELSDGFYFRDASQIGEFWTELFKSFYHDEHPNIDLEDKYDNGLIPLEDIQLYLSRYFDVTIDELHEYVSGMPQSWQNYYISPDKMLFYHDTPRGCYPKPRVTDYRWESDILTITVDLYLSDGVPIHPDIIIKVKEYEDGSFKYISILPQEKIDFYNSFSEEEFLLVKDAEFCLNRATALLGLYYGDILCDDDRIPIIKDQTKYYPLPMFSSMGELKAYSESVFSKDFCENVLYTHPDLDIPTQFLENDNMIYVSTIDLNLHLNDQLSENTIKVLSLDDKIATISADFHYMGDKVGTYEFYLVYENNRWVLDTYYSYNDKAVELENRLHCGL